MSIATSTPRSKSSRVLARRVDLFRMLRQGAEDMDQLRQLMGSGLFYRCGRLLAHPDDRRELLSMISHQLKVQAVVSRRSVSKPKRKAAAK
jgi:hypothetical protein